MIEIQFTIPKDTEVVKFQKAKVGTEVIDSEEKVMMELGHDFWKFLKGSHREANKKDNLEISFEREEVFGDQ